MNNHSTIYASVDLELSGFDPDIDEIIEIGIARYVVQNGATVLLDSWESLIKPGKAIRDRIIGLTGISDKEAQRAPLWVDVRPKIIELLQDVVIVGHGVELDCKFLEAKGVPLSGQKIDTLELAQIFLPTHHSYNLENLARELAVSHTAAHRAFADAEATMGVLIKIAGLYGNLSQEGKTKITTVAEAQKYLWIALFNALTVHAEIAVLSDTKTVSEITITPPSTKSIGLVLTTSGQNIEPEWESLKSAMPPWVIAVSSRERVFTLARKEEVTPYLGAYEQLSHAAVQDLIDKAGELTSKEAIALCKVLVWQLQGSKHNILAELNWSIIGTELKRLFTTGYGARTPRGFAVTDFRSLSDFREQRNVWIEYIDTYIAWLEQKSGFQLAWQAMTAGVRQIYNPETGFGDASRKEEVIQAIADIDVFFVRIILLIKKEIHVVQGAFSEEDLGQYVFSRIHQAALNLKAKLGLVVKNSDTQLVRALDSLDMFFTEKNATYVRWIELSDTRCALVMRPIKFDAKLNGNRTVFTSDVHNPTLARFLEKRMEVTVSERVNIDRRDSNFPEIVLTPLSVRMELAVTERINTAGRSLIVFPNLAQLKEYYDQHYEKFSKGEQVVAVGIHGGVNKIMRNFAHSSKAKLLICVPHLIGFVGNTVTVDHVVFAGLPSVDLAHPYNKRLSEEYFDSSKEFVQSHQLLQFLQSLRAVSMSHVKVLELLHTLVDTENARLLVQDVKK